MSSKYDILVELIEQWLATEKEKLEQIKNKNSVMAGMSMGAIEAYSQVLSDIEELEREAALPE